MHDSRQALPVDEAVSAPPRILPVLRRFWIGNWLLMGLVASRFLLRAHPRSPLAIAFIAADFLLYTLAYVSVVLGPAMVVAAWLDSRFGPRGAFGRGSRKVLLGGSALGLAVAHLVVFADAEVLDLYGFHFNGFVWNLLTVPGGIESLGAGRSTYVAVAGLAVFSLAVQGLLLWLSVRGGRRAAARVPQRGKLRPVAQAALLLALVGFERLTYGLSDAANYLPVTTQADLFPFHVRVRMHRFARAIGLEVERSERDSISVGVSRSRLSYPRAPLRTAAGSPRYNVVWLVSESWRADMLDPHVMPNTSAFAARALDFRRHWSGGNGTRMGMFSMFYGLYGSYWFPVLAANKSPALLDLLVDGGYDLHARTSARFSFPEFDETIFARFPADHLTEGDPDLAGWENDRKHVDALLAEIDARDPSRPFFEFLFFESPHARYYFPPESVIAEPYLDNMNYATMDLERDIVEIKNRYVNSCHHLDQQLGRVLAHLETTGLLDRTIVVMTGDHGEEFLEHGRWGHHSDWSDEQSRTPLVLWIPGQPAQRIESRTSHLDIAPTLAASLGVENPTEDWCFGFDLLTAPPRHFNVVADWDHLALFTDRWKAAFPMQSAGAFGATIFDTNLEPVEDRAPFWDEELPSVTTVLGELARFVH